ncbi:HEAT repeat domain-containing protein [Parafilimonas sp.]|uniref:HEAT repeat domain-containing protein n=1 Tax=Parafilimonas sp. TaxID=1969739 RepID=UPI003F7D323A
MQCYDVESLLIDYLDAQLHPNDRAPLEKHLNECIQCRQALEEYRQIFDGIQKDKIKKPGPALREKFENMLQSELNIEATANIVNKPEEKAAVVKPINRYALLYRIAASIILIVSGFFIGTTVTNNKPGNGQVAELKNEVREMKETLTVKLLNEESASERIKAVSYADEITDPDNKIVMALITTLNEDDNVNVRLAALYALAKFSNSNKVSDALVASLGKQTEPLMQIALINILTEKKETKAKAPIQEILKDKNTLPPVKEIAEKGLKVL